MVGAGAGVCVTPGVGVVVGVGAGVGVGVVLVSVGVVAVLTTVTVTLLLVTVVVLDFGATTRYTSVWAVLGAVTVMVHTPLLLVLAEPKVCHDPLSKRWRLTTTPALTGVTLPDRRNFCPAFTE